jgi:hypothetical protein
MSTTRVSLEIGKTWVFASALDWPGWCRRGKGEEAALEALLEYADRYAAVAGPEFAPGEPEVVGRSPGTSTTDFGAPDARGEWDDEPLGAAETARLAAVLVSCWTAFDRVVGAPPPPPPKGPPPRPGPTAHACTRPAAAGLGDAMTSGQCESTCCAALPA